MAYLQLAENPYYNLADMRKDLYIFVPEGFEGAQEDMYIREDKFDNLPENEYQILMAKLAPFQPDGLSGKRGDARRARKDERRKQRQEAKQKRVETRSEALGKFVEKAGDIVGNIVRKTPANVDVQGGGLDISYSTEPSFFERNRVPLLIGGIALIGGGIYLATRKKSKR